MRTSGTAADTAQSTSTKQSTNSTQSTDPAAEAALRAALATIPLQRLREAGLEAALLELAGSGPAAPPAPNPEDPTAPRSRAGDIDALDAESLIRLALDTAS